MSLRDLLARIPVVAVPPTSAILDGIEASVRYLASDAAIASIAADPYWPKWDGPWWHMVLLWELGEARRIPARAVQAMVDGLVALPLHIFPLSAAEVPAGLDPGRASACHCALGAMDQVLAACGVDVDAALPWVRPWYARYQMADGGYSCDEEAYAVVDEVPSSMVGTVAPLEAMLRRGPSEVATRAAAMLLGRALHHGSSTRHNADERVAAPAWLQPTFPRFYFYDVLRGLRAVTRWSAMVDEPLPVAAITHVVTHLAHAFPDGVVRVQRHAFAGKTTRFCDTDGTWERRRPASSFALLAAVSELGAPSAALTRDWAETRASLLTRLG